MRTFLLTFCPQLLWAVAAFHAVLAVLFFRRYARQKRILPLLMGCITVGLLYDALILAVGGFVQPGPALIALSRLRFVFHGALIPLLFPVCAYALDFPKPWRTAIWIVTGILALLGIAEGFATDLALQDVANVVRYSSGEGTPAWAQAVTNILSFGTVIPLMIAGIAVWIRQKTPQLFLSGFFMFLFSALGPATGNTDLIFVISAFGEVLMVLFFLLYDLRKAKSETSAA